MKKCLLIYIVDWGNGMFGFFNGESLNQCANDSDIEGTKSYMKELYDEYDVINFMFTDYNTIKRERKRLGMPEKSLLL